MLQSKKYSKGDIISFKMNTGEEIIAEIVSYETGKYNVTHPLSMMMGQQGLQMVPSLQTSMDTEFAIAETAYVLSGETAEDLVKAYRNIISPIELVQSPSKIIT